MDVSTYTWKEKRNRLCNLIKKVSDENGRDDLEWLKAYCVEIIQVYKERLDVPILAFQDLVKKEHKVRL